MASTDPSNTSIKENPIDAEATESTQSADGAGDDKNITLKDVLPPHEWESERTRDSEISVHLAQRDTWVSHVDFLMTCLSTAVGLGNVWRFPFTAYENGGGAFLLPYFVVLLFVGRPLYLLELVVGQFSSRSAIAIWSCAPIFRGVGYATTIIGACTCIYYMSILATCVMYFVNSFQDPLPWSKCDQKFYLEEHGGKEYFKNFTCFKDHGVGVIPDAVNGTRNYKSTHPELFYYYRVQRVLDNIDHGIGTPIWQNSLCYLAVWIMAFFTSMLGAKSIGRGAYFTAIFPYVILIILFGRAVSLSGATDGIIHFFKPNVSELKNAKVWFNALQQCFFSLGIGYGNVIVYGSYNKFSQSLFVQTTFIAIADTLTSVLAGATVFAILGVLAEYKHEEVKNLAQAGAGLAFISYPELMLTFKSVTYLPQVFSILFFAMLLALGVGSGTSYVSAISAAIYDRFPALNVRLGYKIGVVAVIVLCYFFIGLIFVTPGGLYMVELVDRYAASFIVYVIVCCETFGLCYVYGIHNIIRDMKFMFKHEDTKFSKVAFILYEIWGYCIPVFLVAVIIFYISSRYEPPSIDLFWKKAVPFPSSAIVSGWMMFALIICLIPAFALKVYFTRKTRDWKRRIKASIHPTRKWGPNDPQTYADWMEFKASYKNIPLFRQAFTAIKACISKARGKRQEIEPTNVGLEEIQSEHEDQVDTK